MNEEERLKDAIESVIADGIEYGIAPNQEVLTHIFADLLLKGFPPRAREVYEPQISIFVREALRTWGDFFERTQLVN